MRPGLSVRESTGAEAVDLYQPGAQLSVSSVTTYLAPAPYDSVIVSGTFMDATPSANLTATINWGDGSAPTDLDLPAGSYAFAAPHDYTTDPASGSYSIGVTLSDIFGKTAFAQTTIAINNPAVAFASPGLVLSSTSIVEGGEIKVSGTVVSSDANDTNTVSLNWGDGSAPTTIFLPAGQDTFSTSHTYLNNPAGVGSENYTITGSVANQYNQVGYASASVTVNKVAPQFTAADLILSPATAIEGDTITLSGQFTDPDAAQLVHGDDRLGRRLDSDRPQRARRPGRPVGHAGALYLLDHPRVSEQSARRADRGRLRDQRFGVGRREHHVGRHVDRRGQCGADGSDRERRE